MGVEGKNTASDSSTPIVGFAAVGSCAPCAYVFFEPKNKMNRHSPRTRNHTLYVGILSDNKSPPGNGVPVTGPVRFPLNRPHVRVSCTVFVGGCLFG